MVSTQQIGNLGTELSTASGLPKAIAEQILQKSLEEPSWVVPFNTSGFPLYVSTTGSTGFNSPSSTQTIRHDVLSTNGASQTALTVTAGKTYYLTAVIVQATGAFKSGTIYENDGSTKVMEISATNDTVCITGGNIPLAKYTASQAVKASYSTGCNITFIGYEE